jgi:hypothetical protein
MSPGFLPEFRLLLESPEFGPVDDGCAIPEINPMITNIGSSITEADIDRIQAEEAVSESVKFREFL